MPQMFTISHARKKLKIIPKRSSSTKPPSNTGDIVSAATWRHQCITLPQVATTPAPPWRMRVKWLIMAMGAVVPREMLICMNRSIDLMIFILETMGMMYVEETVIVAVGASQPGVAPYRHEPAKKHRQSKPDETETCGESDAVLSLELLEVPVLQPIATDLHRV